MKNKWIFNRKINSDCKYRLFCLPYAGSGASIYSRIQQYFNNDIEVCPIQLPGRENRRDEELCKDVNKIVDEIVDGISYLLDKPFAILGYSMGGILAYELTLKIYEKFHLRPKKLFMAASSIFRDKKSLEIREMNEVQLMDYLEKSDGVSSKVLKDEVFRKNYFPIIKNDYSLIEEYKFNYMKVPCDIIAFASKDDREVYYKNIRLLKFFTENFKLYPMQGNHFFIRNEYEELCEIVSNELLSY